MSTIIRTPDQRLRVFISSTMRELADERAAAKQAVESLRMTPILFELGARPHPPRELYRAYLDQSHIFIGIYGESYGWVAPDMEISGLEDEYNLAGGKPKLIYVKRTEGREERLAGLLDRVRDDRVSYKPYAEADELQQLIENDLAMLLTEHFETSRSDPVEVRTPAVANLPTHLDRFIGREQEIRSLCDLLTSASDERLITLTGPGGIGKTRLAVEAAALSQDVFEDGLHFVPLGSVLQAEVVVPTIVQALNVQNSNADPLTALIGHLRDRNLLLVLDNFEQVLFAAPEIAQLVEGCIALTVLVTSRAILNVRAEREFPVAPLGLPEEEDLVAASTSEAVQLFVERARALDPMFRLTDANAAAITTICHRLDGLPLALELAAARTRLLQPEAMLARLDTSLELLTKGSRDLPARHQTLRAAIDWSFGLLNDDEKTLFTRMGAFHGGCTLDAAEGVCDADQDLNLLDLMTSLLEKSLVKHEMHGGEPRFAMLRTVWEFARERLHESEDSDAILESHAEFFLALVASGHDELRSAGQTAWLEKLEGDHDNLRAAMRWHLDHDRRGAVAEAGWTLWLFWWLNLHLAEARQLMTEAMGDEGLTELQRGKAAAVRGFMAFWQTHYSDGVHFLGTALEIFRAENFPAGIALCQLPLGFVEASIGSADGAKDRFGESIGLFEESGDRWGAVVAMNALCWTSVAIGIDTSDEVFETAVSNAAQLGTQLDLGMALRNLAGRRSDQGRLDEARDLAAQALKMLWRGFLRGGTSYTIDAVAEIAAREGDDEIAASLFAATSAVREETQAPIIPMFEPRFRSFIDGLRSTMGDDAFERAWERGSGLGMDRAAGIALAWARGETEGIEASEADAGTRS